MMTHARTAIRDQQARTGREDPGQRGNKWWTLVAICLGTFMLLLQPGLI